MSALRMKPIEALYVVVDRDDPETPIGGIWTSREQASDHCPDGYVVLKLIPNVNYISTEQRVN